jgi:ribosomal 50S subunit-recycling heat shock protein
MSRSTEPVAQEASVRLDVWLWAARFFKTRALAKQAADGGKVEVNGATGKPRARCTRAIACASRAQRSASKST